MYLFDVIRNHDLARLHAYLSGGGTLDILNEQGSSPIHEAIYEENYTMLELLLRYGTDVNMVDKYGNTPLHIACLLDDKEAARILLSHGAQVDVTTEDRPWTPLMVALNSNYVELAEWLISNGANLNFEDSAQGWTPLLVACEQGLTEISLRLIQQGSQVDAYIKDGDAKGRSAIHLASYYGEVALIQALLDRGVDVNLVPEGGGLSALHWSVYNNHSTLMRFLLERGADPNLAAGDIYEDRTSLHYAVSCSRRIAMIRELLDFGADPLAKDREAIRPIDLAFRRSKESDTTYNLRVLKLLETYI